LGAIAMSDRISWTDEAEAKLKEIPFFVRPMARKKIESFAQELGANAVTIDIYNLAKQQYRQKV
jgi:Proto-chlorophyllide reductase 57 kD subunit